MAWASKKQYAICMESEEGKDLIEDLPNMSQDEFNVEFGKLLGKSGSSYSAKDDEDYSDDIRKNKDEHKKTINNTQEDFFSKYSKVYPDMTKEMLEEFNEEKINEMLNELLDYSVKNKINKLNTRFAFEYGENPWKEQYILEKCTEKFEKLREEINNKVYSIEINEGEEVLSKFNKKVNNSIDDDDIAKTNPDFNNSSIDDYKAKYNCQRCVVAYVMRKRGYDVEATLRTSKDNAKDVLKHLPNVKGMGRVDWSLYGFEGTKTISNVVEGSEKPRWGGKSKYIKENLKKDISKYPEGATFIVYTQWQGGGSHVFIAENSKNGVRFVDPQSGDKNCEYYFNSGNIKGQSLHITRVDNAKVNKNIKEYIRNARSK